jgi:DsbC/DsbD-like thiol-disulfide interchange protein
MINRIVQKASYAVLVGLFIASGFLNYVEADGHPPISTVVALQSPPNIAVNGYLSSDKAQRGKIVQAAVVMDIPSGYHVNSNRPLEKFLVATQLSVDAPQGVRVGPVSYPRPRLRNFQFSKDKLSVYEGRAVLRFNITVPANFSSGSVELKAKLRYQSCSDSLCFPPQNREVKLELPVVAATESVKRTNAQFFGRK